MDRAAKLDLADRIAYDLRRRAKDDFERPMSVKALVTKLTKRRPRKKQMRNPGELIPVDDQFFIYTREGLPILDEPIVFGHEGCHLWHALTGVKEPPFIEELCDAVGARLAMPEKQFREAIRFYDHRVHKLATDFHVRQRASLLRVSELTGRPGMIKRATGWLARGGDFDWVDDWRAISRAQAHYVRVDDRWGMLANR